MFHFRRNEDEKKTTTTTTTRAAAAAATTTTNCVPVSDNGGSSNKGELERVFTYFDENGDGKVSPAELRKCVKAVGGELTVEEAEMAVRLSDSDGDGLLGIEDFTKLMEGMEEERNKEGELMGAYDSKLSTTLGVVAERKSASFVNVTVTAFAGTTNDRPAAASPAVNNSRNMNFPR